MTKTSGGPSLTLINGVDEKGPAAFLIEVEGRRLLLDIGLGEDRYPEPSLLTPIDAILLSQSHVDHAGALGLVEMIDWPQVYATEASWARLPGHVVPPTRQRRLPLRGTVLIGDVPVQTGRSGHGPGSIWIHLQIGGGLLYMGDWTIESQLFPFDMPPPSALVITDANYHDRIESLAKQAEALIGEARSGAVLPVPAHGHGVELALRLHEAGVTPKICPQIRHEIDRYLGPERHLLKTEATTPLESFAAVVELIDPATLTPAEVAVVAIDHRNPDSPYHSLMARRADGLRVILTSLEPPANDQDSPNQDQPEGTEPEDGEPQDTQPKGTENLPPLRWLPWNTHPTLQHNAKLLARVKAQRVVPAFSPLGKLRLLTKLCEGMAIVTDRQIEI